MGKSRNQIVDKIDRNAPYVLKSKQTTPETPLLPTEQKFLTEFLRTGNKHYSAMKAKLCDKFGKECDDKNATWIATQTLSKVNVQAEIKRIMDELREESVATAQEVMAYFTDVMRGNVKDQFGLDVSIADRTKAAQELAKRTVDVEARKAGNADSVMQIQLNWDRPNTEED